MTASLNLTSLEVAALKNIAHCEMTANNGARPACAADVWTYLWADIRGPAIGISAKAFGGVLTSLQTKGLVDVEAPSKDDKDGFILFTDAGFAAFDAAFPVEAPVVEEAVEAPSILSADEFAFIVECAANIHSAPRACRKIKFCATSEDRKALNAAAAQKAGRDDVRMLLLSGDDTLSYSEFLGGAVKLDASKSASASLLIIARKGGDPLGELALTIENGELAAIA